MSAPKRVEYALARIATAPTLRARFEAKVSHEPMSGCWLWMAYLRPTGYGRICIARGHYLDAHRVAYSLYMGPIPSGLWVLHRCDNRACVNPDHLFLGTRQDNIDDAVRKGRAAAWRQFPHAKLSDDDVVAIATTRERPRGWLARVARKHGVSPGHIWNIVHGRSKRRVLKQRATEGANGDTT